MSPTKEPQSPSPRASAVLADMQWAVCGPALWGTLPPGYSEWVSNSTELWSPSFAHPGAVIEELATHKRTPIGRYFERLIGYWMRQHDDVHHLHENLPVQSNRGTLGELDLVFASGTRAYHWELALKYYLGIGDRTQPRNWYGPRGRDRLDLKLEKLVARQLKLPATREGEALLADLGLVSVSSHCVFKGCFFHPFEDWQAGLHTIPPDANPNHDRGWWLPLARAPQLQTLPVAAWQALEKPSWLSQAVPDAPLAPGALASWLQKSVSESSPILIAALGDDGCEMHRGFVVPDTWPPMT